MPMMTHSHTIRGGLIILASMFLIGLIDNFVPYIAEHSSVWQFHMVRSVIAGSIVIIFCLMRGQRVWPRRFLPVCIRSVFVAGSMILYFTSLSLMPIAVAGAGMFSSPIFILLFSLMLFGTRIGVWRSLAVLIGFTGAIMVLKPDPFNLGLVTFVPLMAGCLYAMGQIFTRHFCSDEHTATVLLGFLVMIGFFGFVGTLLFSFVSVPTQWQEDASFFFSGWTGISREFLFWTFIQAAGSTIAVAGLIRGYQIAEPTHVTVFEYSFLVFAGFWGWVLWGQVPDLVSVVGIIFIILAGCTIAYRASRTRLGEGA